MTKLYWECTASILNPCHYRGQLAIQYVGLKVAGAGGQKKMGVGPTYSASGL
jgi:hypothetical protein